MKRLFANKLVWAIIAGLITLFVSTPELITLFKENPVVGGFAILSAILAMLMDSSTPGISDKTKIIVKHVDDIVDIMEEMYDLLIETEQAEIEETLPKDEEEVPEYEVELGGK